MYFYTNVSRLGKFLLVRGYQDGVRVHFRHQFKPTFYLPGSTPSKIKTIDGRHAAPISFNTMKEGMEFQLKYEDTDGFEIHGSTNYQYVYMNEMWPGQIEYDQSLVRSVNIDIEVDSENGFPDPEDALAPITAITMKYQNTFFVFGCGDFDSSKYPNVEYEKCFDEEDLIRQFLDVWNKIDPDVVTGWNIQFFDIPYLVNRITRVCSEQTARRLSPWYKITSKVVTSHGRAQTIFDLIGVSILDYLEMYKNFTQNKRESYRLDYIAHIELKEKKLDYSEYQTLHKLYQENYQKFIEYNIKDVKLVDGLDNQLKMIEMVLAIAYDAKVNYRDVFAQVRLWDTIIHNYLIDRNIAVPPKKYQNKFAQYAGAYVKTPQTGMHKWVVSLDLVSMYPSLIMQYNLSPETLVGGPPITTSVDDLLKDKWPYFDPMYCFAANGHLFKKTQKGILPEILERMFQDRDMAKKKMLKYKKELEECNNSDEKKRLKQKVKKYDVFQKTKKVQLNSCYGALGNQYFRFYDLRIAEAVTLSGQLVIRWIDQQVNQYLNKLLKTDGIDYIIASDTDSIYVRLDELIQKVFDDDADPKKIDAFITTICKKKLEPAITNAMQKLANTMSCNQNKMIMKQEVVADKGIWTAKKHYVLNVYSSEGVVYETPKLKMMGIESIKSSTPEICRDKIKKGFRNCDETR